MGVLVRLLVPTVGSAQNEVIGLPEESAADLVANHKAVYVDPEPKPDDESDESDESDDDSDDDSDDSDDESD